MGRGVRPDAAAGRERTFASAERFTATNFRFVADRTAGGG